MKHFVTGFLLLFSTIIIYSQYSAFKGIVVDSEDLKPVSFPTVTCGKEAIYADENGIFFMKNFSTNDTIEISCLGYERKDYIYTGKLTDSILLSRKPYLLQEVLISNVEEKKKKRTIACKGERFGSSIYIRGEIAMFIPNDKGEKIFIDQVLLGVENASGRVPYLHLRLHFYKNEGDMPGNEITQTNIVSKVSSKKVTFDSFPSILLPTDGFFCQHRVA